MPCLFWIALPWVIGPVTWFETMRAMGLTADVDYVDLGRPTCKIVYHDFERRRITGRSAH